MRLHLGVHGWRLKKADDLLMVVRDVQMQRRGRGERRRRFRFGRRPHNAFVLIVELCGPFETVVSYVRL